MADHAGRIGARRRARLRHRPRHGKFRVVGRHRLPGLRAQPPGDRPHRGILPKAGGVVFQLLVQIARSQARKPGDRIAVAGSVQTMAGETGVGRPAVSAAHGHQSPGPAERRVGDGRAFATAGEQQAKQEGGDRAHTPATRARVAGSGNCPAFGGFLNRAGGGDAAVDIREGRRFLAVSLAGVTLAACAETPVRPRQLADADPQRGRNIAERLACAACHQIPGIAWPEGRVGGPLAGFSGRPLIAGRFPNQPDILVQWLRDAPSLAPGTGMPPQDLSPADARDVAAFLYTLE